MYMHTHTHTMTELHVSQQHGQLCADCVYNVYEWQESVGGEQVFPPIDGIYFLWCMIRIIIMYEQNLEEKVGVRIRFQHNMHQPSIARHGW